VIIVKDRVRYVETDMMGVVHHSNYLRWFEMGRVAFLRKAGVNMLELLDDGIVTPITRVEAQYKHSLRLDDEYEIQTHMSALNRAKMEFTYEVVKIATGEICVTGFTQNLFSTTDGKIVRLPAKWYEPIKALYDAEQNREKENGL